MSQDGTVDDYIRLFEALAVRARPVSNEQEVEIFIMSGLQEFIAVELDVHRPKDLDQCYDFGPTILAHCITNHDTSRKLRYQPTLPCLHLLRN